MKKSTLYWLAAPTIFLLLVVIILCSSAYAAGWKADLSVGFGYDRATWKDHWQVSNPPDGPVSESCIYPYIGLDVRTDTFKLPWGLEPTVKAFFKYEQFNFKTGNANFNPQKTSPLTLGIVGGLTKEFKPWWMPNVYVLGGIAYVDFNLNMVEKVGDTTVKHGGVGSTFHPVIETGIFKTWRIYKSISVGPFVNVQIYPNGLSWRHCKDNQQSIVTPNAGLMIQFGK